MDSLSKYTSALFFAISFFMLMAIYFAFKFKSDLWCTNLWYSIWKRRKLAGDTNLSNRGSGWTRSELTLCRDYQKYVPVTSESEFRKLVDYLTKAKDLGRKPLPSLMAVLIAVLVAAEGLGFFYMLSPWISVEGSENTRILLILGNAFVLATITAFVMYHAGHQLFRANLIRNCKRAWRMEGGFGTLRTQQVLLRNAQSVDDDQPRYTQCLNRVDGNGSYAAVIFAIVVFVLIALSLAWMRYGLLRATSFDNTASPIATDAVTSAFPVLFLIYIATQFVIVFSGYRWGFVGVQSKHAYKATHGFTAFNKYQTILAPAIHAANAQLRKLHQEMAANDGSAKIKTLKTFDDYLSLIAMENEQPG